MYKYFTFISKYPRNTEQRIKENTFMEWVDGVESGIQGAHSTLQKFAYDTSAKNTAEVTNKIFRDHSFNFLSDENYRIQHVICKTMECLVKKLGESDSDFMGSLVGVGSYFDGTRVGTAPNEFDYILVLKDLSNSISKVQRTGTGEYRLQIKSDSTNASSWLSNILLHERLYTLIDRIMDSIVLSEDLHQGGILCPCFSGIRKNGPAFTLLFAWTGDSYTETPLLISIDITVAVRPAHLERYSDEEANLTHLLKSLKVENDGEHYSYLIAHPYRDDVWLMTSAALDVSIMCILSQRCIRIIRRLKILTKDFLTIQERSLHYPLCHRLSDILANFTDIFKIKNILENRVEDISDYSSAVAHLDMKQIVSHAKATRRFWLECYTTKAADVPRKGNISPEDAELKLSETGVIPGVFKEVAKLIHTECCAYLKKYSSEEGATEASKTELDYLADLLPPEVCDDAFEDHKPAITLKSCVFKYVIIGALLSGNLPRCFPEENDTDRTDLEAIVWVLEQIRKSKTISHPLLGIPIQTYSLSYRGYVVTPRSLFSHIEKRLSDVLYRFLDILIATLRKGTAHDCAGVQEHTEKHKPM